MKDRLQDQRIGDLIGAYADLAPVQVEPLAMARLAAAGARTRSSFRLGPVTTRRAFALIAGLMALLAAILTGALVAGRQPHPDLDPTTVIAQHAEFHRGYVFVYADGRVVMHRDADGSLVERRLTQQGIDQVRSGTVQLDVFLRASDRCRFFAGDPLRSCLADVEADRRLLDGAWMEAGPRPYHPSMFAACHADDAGSIEPAQAYEKLPPAAAALLRGKERTFRPVPFLGPDDQSIVCSAITSSDARRLVERLGAAGFEAESNGPQADFLDDGSDGGGMVSPSSPSAPGVTLSVWLQPLLPQGTWATWGG